MRFAVPVSLITALALSAATPAIAQDAAAIEPAAQATAQEPAPAVADAIASPLVATAPTAKPKRSFAENAAIAAGTIGAAVSAFAALRALTKPKPATPVPTDAPPAQAAAATPF